MREYPEEVRYALWFDFHFYRSTLWKRLHFNWTRLLLRFPCLFYFFSLFWVVELNWGLIVSWNRNCFSKELICLIPTSSSYFRFTLLFFFQDLKIYFSFASLFFILRWAMNHNSLWSSVSLKSFIWFSMIREIKMFDFFLLCKLWSSFVEGFSLL